MSKKVLTFVAELFDERELIYPAYRVEEAGYMVTFAGKEATTYAGKEGLTQEADVAYSDVAPEDYAGLLIPGGFAPDKIRKEEAALEIVRAMHQAGKPIGMICHAGWVGVSAEILEGRKVTSTPTIKIDLTNAGATWVDEAPVVDGNIVTARNPKDLAVYAKAFIELLD